MSQNFINQSHWELCNGVEREIFSFIIEDLDKSHQNSDKRLEWLDTVRPNF